MLRMLALQTVTGVIDNVDEFHEKDYNLYKELSISFPDNDVAESPPS